MAVDTQKTGAAGTARAEAELPDANITKEQHRSIMSFMVEVGDTIDLQEYPALLKAVQGLPETHRDLIMSRYEHHVVGGESVDRVLDFFGTVQLTEDGFPHPLTGKPCTAYTGKVHIHTPDVLGDKWRDSDGATFLAHICGETTQVVIPGKLINGWTAHSADEEYMQQKGDRCILQ